MLWAQGLPEMLATNRMPACRRTSLLLVFSELLGLMMCMPARGQNPSPPPSSPPSGNSPVRPPAPTRTPTPQMQVPLRINGRVVTETGQPFPGAVSVEMNCGMKTLQAVHTDLKGYFNITMGLGAQSNMDYSAANSIAILSEDGNILPTPGVQNSPSDVLSGCEIRVHVPGYRPLTYTMHGRADLGRVDVGTLIPSRIAGPGGPAISVTSLLVPEGARREYEQGEKDLQKNNLKAAAQHMEKAVAKYARFAAAWNELGRIYVINNEGAKARPAFEKAIAADPTYPLSYINLANLQLQNRENESAVANAEKALEIDSDNRFAHMIAAMGNFNLNRMDVAEQSALAAEKGPHQNFTQLHALLANIYMRNRNYSGAAEQMRAYLKESPQGEFAGQMKANLDQIEKSAGGAGSYPASAEAQPSTTP